MRFFGKCLFILPKGKTIDLGYSIQIPKADDHIELNGKKYVVWSVQPCLLEGGLNLIYVAPVVTVEIGGVPIRVD